MELALNLLEAVASIIVVVFIAKILNKREANAIARNVELRDWVHTNSNTWSSRRFDDQAALEFKLKNLNEQVTTLNSAVEQQSDNAGNEAFAAQAQFKALQDQVSAVQAELHRRDPILEAIVEVLKTATVVDIKKSKPKTVKSANKKSKSAAKKRSK